VSFFSLDMWVTGVGLVPPVGQKYKCKRSIGESRWLVWRLWGNMIFVLTCIWSHVYYRVPDSALVLYLVR
jgi:hypothetical protein